MLADSSTHVQVVAVLAHELGHWKLGHTICLMLAQQSIMLSQFVLFAVFRNSDTLMAAFGFHETRPVVVTLTLFMMVLSPMDKLITWLFNLLSRRCAPCPALSLAGAPFTSSLFCLCTLHLLSRRCAPFPTFSLAGAPFTSSLSRRCALYLLSLSPVRPSPRLSFACAPFTSFLAAAPLAQPSLPPVRPLPGTWHVYSTLCCRWHVTELQSWLALILV